MKNVIYLFISMILLSSCAGTGNANNEEAGQGTFSSDLDLEITSSNPQPISLNGPIQASSDSEDSHILGPDQLIDITNVATFSAPDNCEQICQATMGCNDGNLSSSEQTSCQNSCNRETGGLCSDLSIARDPYTLTGFTVPAGYKKAEIELEHCTDRQDNLHISGNSMSFMTMNPAMLHVGNGWRNMSFLGANVGRGANCESYGLWDIAKLKVKVTNSSGTVTTQQYVWKMPALNDLTLDGILADMDLTAPTFAHIKAMVGPGIKTYRIYDNYQANDQLDFVAEYYFWYDPKYTTKIDFYYKKRFN
ncbi:MAG: hypothetical protein KDD50_01900 [Bdellovibrionales bacterium]|nr:hypothetical protein [Bdellovibrionales bacterium]